MQHYFSMDRPRPTGPDIPQFALTPRSPLQPDVSQRTISPLTASQQQAPQLQQQQQLTSPPNAGQQESQNLSSQQRNLPMLQELQRQQEDRRKVEQQLPYNLFSPRKQDQFQVIPPLPCQVEPYNLPAYYSYFKHDKGLVLNKDEVDRLFLVDEQNDFVDHIVATFTIHEVSKQYFPVMKLQSWLCETYIDRLGEVDSMGLQILSEVEVPMERGSSTLEVQIPRFKYNGDLNNRSLRQFFRFVLINSASQTIVSFIDSALFVIASNSADTRSEKAELIAKPKATSHTAPLPPPSNSNGNPPVPFEQMYEQSLDMYPFASFNQTGIGFRRPEKRDRETVRAILSRTLVFQNNKKINWHKVLGEFESQFSGKPKRSYHQKSKNSLKRIAYDTHIPNKRARYIPETEQFINKPAFIFSIVDSSGPTVGGVPVQIFVNDLDVIDLDTLTIRFGAAQVPKEDIFYVSPIEIRCLLPPQYEEGFYDVSLAVEDEASSFSYVLKEGFRYRQLGQYIKTKEKHGELFSSDMIQAKDPLLLFSSVATDSALADVPSRKLMSLPLDEPEVQESVQSTSAEVDSSLKSVSITPNKARSGPEEVQLATKKTLYNVDVYDYLTFIKFSDSAFPKEDQTEDLVDRFQWHLRTIDGADPIIEYVKDPIYTTSGSSHGGVDTPSSRQPGNTAFKQAGIVVLRLHIRIDRRISSAKLGGRKFVLKLYDSVAQKYIYTSGELVIKSQLTATRRKETPNIPATEPEASNFYRSVLEEQSNNYNVHVRSAKWTPLGQSPLHKACLSGSRNEIVQAVANGYFSRTSDYFDRTPMHYAFAAGYIEAAEYLLKQADGFETLLYEDYYYLTPFHLAVKYHRYEFLNWVTEFIQKEMQLKKPSDLQPPLIVVTDNSPAPPRKPTTKQEPKSVPTAQPQTQPQTQTQAQTQMAFPPQGFIPMSLEQLPWFPAQHHPSPMAQPLLPVLPHQHPMHFHAPIQQMPPQQPPQPVLQSIPQPIPQMKSMKASHTTSAAAVPRIQNTQDFDEDSIFTAMMTPFRNRSVQNLRTVNELNKHPYKYAIKFTAPMDRVIRDPSLKQLSKSKILWELHYENGEHIPNGVEYLSKPEVTFKDGVGVEIELPFSLLYCSHNLKNRKFILKLSATQPNSNPPNTRVLYTSDPISVYARRRTPYAPLDKKKKESTEESPSTPSTPSTPTTPVSASQANYPGNRPLQSADRKFSKSPIVTPIFTTNAAPTENNQQ